MTGSTHVVDAPESGIDLQRSVGPDVPVASVLRSKLNGVELPDSEDIDAAIDDLLRRRPMVGAALGVVRGNGSVHFRGAGFADIARHRPISSDTVFRIASISKTVTAVAIMQLWERGLVELDAPAESYLRSYVLQSASPHFRPATLRDLLTHTSGAPESVHPWRTFRADFGESVRLEDRVPTLAEYYRGGLRLAAEPGTRFCYGNHGFATLGQIVEDVTRMSLRQYFREEIFRPLGMDSADLRQTTHLLDHLAVGYTIGRHGPVPVVDRTMITAGAASVYASAQDMGRYLAALLGGGANDSGRILRPGTIAQMFAPQYQPDPRIPGLGLAFFRYETAGHRLVEHGGIMPGFTSDIFLAPDDDVAVMIFTNGAHGATLWLPVETGELLNRMLRVRAAGIRTDVAHHPELWNQICGRYIVPGRWSDIRSRMMMGAGAEVVVKHGRLVLRLLSPIPVEHRGFELHPDDPDDPFAFRLDLTGVGLGTGRILFSIEPGTNETVMHFDLYPISVRRSPRS
jgi:CubicO group peptidase (beta-lactamase class C family)